MTQDIQPYLVCEVCHSLPCVCGNEDTSSSTGSSGAILEPQGTDWGKLAGQIVEVCCWVAFIVAMFACFFYFR